MNLRLVTVDGFFDDGDGGDPNVWICPNCEGASWNLIDDVEHSVRCADCGTQVNIKWEIE